ncbi:MAG: outer membrane protein beta-barrel domain [Candidatus Binatota bacterium]|nr:outer membrane protein beta-barrel domain [Candidatus Binatota bacterium]
MKRFVGLGLWLALAFALGSFGDAAAEEPTRTPDRVSIAFGVGGILPTGKFADAADAGFAYSFSGYYHLTDWFGPAFVFQQGFLESDPSTGVHGGSVDTYSLAGGVRAYVLPPSFMLRPWVTLLGGYHRYAQHRKHELTPIFAIGHDDRDDPFLSIGGGAELRLHPNFGLGADLRYNASFSDSDDRGERDLGAFTIAALLILHY